MKTTGITRRIDDLGRVIIPRDIRRMMRLREGEPLEIFIEGNNTICFRKYGITLSNGISHLMNDVEDSVVDCEKKAQIMMLLSEARRLIEREDF